MSFDGVDRQKRVIIIVECSKLHRIPPYTVRIDRVNGFRFFVYSTGPDRSVFYGFYNNRFSKACRRRSTSGILKRPKTLCCRAYHLKTINRAPSAADERCAYACTFGGRDRARAFAGVSAVPKRSKFTNKLLSNGRGAEHNTRYSYTRIRVHVYMLWNARCHCFCFIIALSRGLKNDKYSKTMATQ